jgi:CRISPR-associated protein Csm4
MVYYRITITPLGPLSTAWVSGTIWGHIAWAIRYVEGKESLNIWMKEQETTPWLFSSQMPKDMLPKPLLTPMTQDAQKPSLEEFNLIKKARKISNISEDFFYDLRDNLNELVLLEALKAELQKPTTVSLVGSKGLKPLQLFHNRIDRQTGRTPEAGGLFVENSRWAENNYRFQVFIATDNDCLNRLKVLFEFVGNSGFGANASTGRGCFSFDITEENRLFRESGNRAMSLSHGVITTNMGNPRYKQHTHYGKLGGHFTTGAYSPFKYPVLMALPGATFKPCGKPPFGKLLAGVHHDSNLDFIRHHALHLPIYFTEVTT